MKKVFNDYLRIFGRIIAWVLVVVFVAYVFTGYGITNPEVVVRLTGGLLTHTYSLYLHMALALPVLVLVMVHVLLGLRFALIRWGVKDGVLLNVFILILGLFSLVLLMLMNRTIF
jgi:hypothetical protein